MSKFSTFSIYEKEMRQFIQKLKEQHVAVDTLTEWLYDSGITVFQKSQAVFYYPYAADCQKKYNHRPLISFNHSQGQHYTGLGAVRDSMIRSVMDKVFTQTLDIIESTFNAVLLPAIVIHSAFIKIESEVASEFNDFLDKHGEQTPMQSLEKVIELFEARQGQNLHLREDLQVIFKSRLNRNWEHWDLEKDLQNDFKNKLTLMKEVLAEMKKALVDTSKNSSNQFFKQEVTPNAGPASTVPLTGPSTT